MPTFANGTPLVTVRGLLNDTGLRKNDYAAQEDPTPDYDERFGWEPGSRILAGGVEWICKDAAIGAAVWVPASDESAVVIATEAKQEAGEADAKATAAQLPPFVPFATRADIALTNLGDVRRISVAGVGDYRQAVGPIAYTPAAISADGIMLVPDGPVTPEHFGARGDLEWTMGGNGPVRASGTNDRAAFIATDAFAKLFGKPVQATGQYYLEGQWEPTAVWVGSEDHTPVIWSKYGVYETGIWIKSSFAAVRGFRLIGQYDRGGVPKPGNAGHLGNIIVAGPGFLMPVTQSPVEQPEIDVRVCRAANVSGQTSDASPISNFIGYVLRGRRRIGLFGHSNVSSGIMVQSHWGGQIDFPGWDISQDPGGYPVLETYHPEECQTTWFDEEMDCAAHTIGRLWVESATINSYIGPCSSNGAMIPITIFPGDEVNRVANAQQKTRVGKGLRFGFQRHVNCNPAALSALEPVLIVGRGTSKSVISHGSTFKIDQLGLAVKGDGLDIHQVSGSYAVRVLAPMNDIDPGPIRNRATGVWPIAVYAQTGSGHRIDAADCEGTIRVRHATVDHLRAKTAMGWLIRPNGHGDYNPGFGATNSAVAVEGTAYTTTLTADVSFGDTQIAVDGFTNSVEIGETITIGGVALKCSRFANSGAPVIEVEPALVEALSGATVSMVKRAVVKRLVGEFTSSEMGLYITYGDVLSADLSGVYGCGRYAARVGDEASLTVDGGRLPTVGYLKTADPMIATYTIRVHPTGKLRLNGVYIPANPMVDKHLQLQRTSGAGPWATAVLTGCVIENPANLVRATVPSEHLTLIGCVKPDGTPVTIADV